VPHWIEDRAMKDVEAKEGDSIEFECNAGGAPEPELSWALNGVPIESKL